MYVRCNIIIQHSKTIDTPFVDRLGWCFRACCPSIDNWPKTLKTEDSQVSRAPAAPWCASQESQQYLFNLVGYHWCVIAVLWFCRDPAAVRRPWRIITADDHVLDRPFAAWSGHAFLEWAIGWKMLEVWRCWNPSTFDRNVTTCKILQWPEGEKR